MVSTLETRERIAPLFPFACAEHVRLGTPAAVKVLVRDDESAKVRFEREARLLARLKSAAFPRFFAYGEDKGSAYIAMELLEPGDMPAGDSAVAKGNVVLSPLWALLTSALWVTGTMSIAGVGEIAQRTSWAAFALMTLAVNFRYAFYGFTMLSRWKDVPLLRKAYLVLMLTDENYALEAGCDIRDSQKNLCYCTALSVLNHSYWVVGVVAGAVAVCALGQVVDPDRLRSWTNGMEFSMAALFLVIFTDQVRSRLTYRNQG